MAARLFRFRICFEGVADYIGSNEYTSRRECIHECLSLIKWMKETRPELAKAYRTWNYHSHAAGEPEPEWNDRKENAL